MGDEPRDGAARSVRSAETFGANFSSFLTVSSIFNSRRFALTEPIKEKTFPSIFYNRKKKFFSFEIIYQCPVLIRGLAIMIVGFSPG